MIACTSISGVLISGLLPVAILLAGMLAVKMIRSNKGGG